MAGGASMFNTVARLKCFGGPHNSEVVQMYGGMLCYFFEDGHRYAVAGDVGSRYLKYEPVMEDKDE